MLARSESIDSSRVLRCSTNSMGSTAPVLVGSSSPARTRAASACLGARRAGGGAARLPARGSTACARARSRARPAPCSATDRPATASRARAHALLRGLAVIAHVAELRAQPIAFERGLRELGLGVAQLALELRDLALGVRGELADVLRRVDLALELRDPILRGRELPFEPRVAALGELGLGSRRAATP